MLNKGEKMQEKTNFWGPEEFCQIFRESEYMDMYVS